MFEDREEYVIAVTSEGYSIKNDGYRASDASSKLLKVRVFEGDKIKVLSDDKFQFQSTTTINASGINYRVGATYGSGVYYLTVPETAMYVIMATPIANSNAHVYKLMKTIDAMDEELAGAKSNILSIYDAYTSKVSDIPYAGDLGITTIGVNTDVPCFVSGSGQAICIPIIGGTSIKVTKPQTTTCLVCFTQDRPKVNMPITHYMSMTGVVNTEFVAESQNDDKYLVIYVGSAQITASEYVFSITSSNNSEKITDDINALNTKLNEVGTNIATFYNAYTSQVSDIPYLVNSDVISIGIDTSIPAFTAGSGHVICIPIISGTSIRVIKPQTPVCLVCFTQDRPKANTPITHYTSMTGIVNTEFVAISQDSDKYLVIYVGSAQIIVSDYGYAFSQTARGTVELLSQLDTHMINLLKYRPVGKVSKPYIALSCDDGLEPLAIYTLPRIQYWNDYYNTNIPLHMALFDGSPVFANAEQTALVRDMCENHNCSIGIHGTQPYEYYSSSTALYAYLKKQWNTIIEKTGVTPTSVIYPHSSYNDRIMVMAAGFCGICGASGSDPSPYTYCDDTGLYFYIGEKSNCYEIYRLSIRDTRIAGGSGIERIIDYAYANNLIICPYFHDIDLDESHDGYVYNRSMLDKFITYGMEKGIEFINFGDIPYLL